MSGDLAYPWGVLVSFGCKHNNSNPNNLTAPSLDASPLLSWLGNDPTKIAQILEGCNNSCHSLPMKRRM